MQPRFELLQSYITKANSSIIVSLERKYLFILHLLFLSGYGILKILFTAKGRNIDL